MTARISVDSSVAVVLQAAAWAEDKTGFWRGILTPLDLLLLMAKLRLSQDSLASPAHRFLVRAGLRMRHREGRDPLVLLAGVRLERAGADPVRQGLRDLARIADAAADGQADAESDRLLHRLAAQAGREGCDLRRLALLLHASAGPEADLERVADAAAILGRTGADGSTADARSSG